MTHRHLINRTGSMTAAFLTASAMLNTVPHAAAAPSADGLYINEVCTQNKHCFTDSLGKASDWIELYNGGNQAVDLSGFGLSDDAAHPMKFVFPSGTAIAPNAYLLIVAAKKGTYETELNTGFGLGKSGETLLLSLPDGSGLQTLEIPALPEDTTYGRTSDGRYAVMTPTPASANHAAPAEPVFSLESGFYSADKVRELTITAADKIYYTLDGSDPTTSGTAVLYTGAVPMYDKSADENVYSKYQYEENSPYSITSMQSYEANPEKCDKAAVVRAAAMAPDGSFSRVISKTYFVMPEDKLKFYAQIPVISVVTDPKNLFDKDTGIYVAGQQYMDWLNAAEQDDASGECANYLSAGKEWEREADVTYFKEGALGFTQKMGIRIRGVHQNQPRQELQFLCAEQIRRFQAGLPAA